MTKAEPRYLTTAQAAPRLGVDQSTVGKYIRLGLTIGRGKRARRLYLKATRQYVRRGTRMVWTIRPSAVRKFKARRGGKS
jgi:hypothetical protein